MPPLDKVLVDCLVGWSIYRIKAFHSENWRILKPTVLKLDRFGLTSR